VPPDGVAHIHPDLAGAALKMMERNTGVRPTPCDDVRFEEED
jgi:hypothetical protein